MLVALLVRVAMQVVQGVEVGTEDLDPVQRDLLRRRFLVFLERITRSLPRFLRRRSSATVRWTVGIMRTSRESANRSIFAQVTVTEV